MKKSNYKPQIPDLMEAVFDAVYLTFDLAAAALFLFSKEISCMYYMEY